MQDAIKEIISRHLGKVLVNEKISNYTTYRVGGKVRCIVYPKGEKELIELVDLLKSKNIKYFTLGNGSNVLFSDQMYDGVIIKLDNFNKIEINGNKIYVEAGYPLIKLSNVAVKNGLAGLEFASGIPGTVGGALFMNAGAYGEDMSKIVTSARVLVDGEIKEFSNSELQFSYRTTMLQDHLDYICISVNLELKEGKTEELEEIVNLRREQRRSTQPLNFPSAGSVFRNPPGMYAGKLIEDLGLKGYTIGKALVSPKHANFIVNTGNAKASDIKNIIDFIKLKAKATYGINLHVEQRLINWVGVNEKESEEEEDKA
jgi:UDP-N-acetylmuramate dehydrogenase